MQESQTAQSNTGLIYGLNDRPPVREAIFAAIQHLLAIFVARSEERRVGKEC